MSVTALVDTEEGVWSNYFCNKQADTDSNSRISFTESNPMRFYPYDGSRMLRFYATSPWRESWTMDESSHILTFALSGQEDLMWGKDERGISKEFDPATQTQPKFDFTHKLTRFNFRCRAGEGFPNRIRLTEIKMYGVCYKGTLDVIDGALTWDDVSTTDYTIPTEHIISLSDTYNYICGITAPACSEITFHIVTSGEIVHGPFTIPATSIQGGNDGLFHEGKSYDINLIFDNTGVTVSPMIGLWEDGGSTTITTIGKDD